MLDSWAKPERGILNGNLNWIGAYDECLNVTIPASSDPTLNFSPQYCTLNTKLSLGVCNCCKECKVYPNKLRC